jgi:hypothetical protein
VTAATAPEAPPCADTVRDLLAAYEQAGAALPRLRRVVMLRAGRGRVARRLRLPLPTLLTGTLLRHHAARTAAALERRYHVVAALAGRDAVRGEVEALEDFGRSVAPVRVGRLLLAFALAVLAVAYLLSDLVFRAQAEARGTAGAIRALVTFDRGGLVGTVEAFDRAEALGATFILGLSVCLVLWLPAASFQLKQALLAVLPARPEDLDGAALHDGSSGGAYELERVAFGAVGGQPPAELRLDRILAGALLVIPLWGAVVLASLAMLAGRGRIGSLGDGHAVALSVTAVLLLLWTANRSLALLGGRRAHRRVEIALATVLVAAGAVTVAGVVLRPSPPPPVATSVAFQSVRVRANVPPPDDLPAQGTRVRRLFDDTGVALTFRVRISAPSGVRLQSRYSIVEARSRRVFRSALGPAFAGRGGQTSGSVDTSNLLLLRLSRLTSEVGERMTAFLARSQLWIPFSAESGRFYLRLELFDDSRTLLASFQTTPFVVHTRGRFRTKGRFSVATVRG